MKKPLLLLPAAAILLGLTACDPGSGSPTASAPPVGTECIVGDWSADLDDLAGQLADFYVSTGFADELTGSVTGTEEATFGSGHSATTNDNATFVFTGNRAGSPLTMTTVHAGGFQSDWDFADGVLDFTEFEAPHYSITTTVEFEGHTSTLPTSTTEGYAEDIPIDTECSGDVMTMQPENSQFTTTWNRG